MGEQGIFEELAPDDTSEERALSDLKPPSLSNSPRSIISSPSVAVQGAELHTMLTPSTACLGTVAGSRTCFRKEKRKQKRQKSICSQYLYLFKTL